MTSISGGQPLSSIQNAGHEPRVLGILMRISA
jgi:hypothetical protein